MKESEPIRYPVDVECIEWYSDDNGVEMELRIPQWREESFRVPVDQIPKEIGWAITIGSRRFRATANLNTGNPEHLDIRDWEVLNANEPGVAR